MYLSGVLKLVNICGIKNSCNDSGFNYACVIILVFIEGTTECKYWKAKFGKNVYYFCLRVGDNTAKQICAKKSRFLYCNC